MNINAIEIKKEFVRETKNTNVFTAVRTCSLMLSAGEVTVIRGRSGGGKTTLLNMMAGILPPTEGKVLYDGKDIYAMSDEELSVFRNHNIGYVPQGKSAISSLTVRENILLPLTLFGESDEAEAVRLMEQFDIAHLRNAMPEELSGGELRRMAIARALIRKPGVLFADEPTGDLDDENTRLVFAKIRSAAEEGAAVLVITHEGEAGGYADHMYRMDGGVLESWSPLH